MKKILLFIIFIFGIVTFSAQSTTEIKDYTGWWYYNGENSDDPVGEPSVNYITKKNNIYNVQSYYFIEKDIIKFISKEDKYKFCKYDGKLDSYDFPTTKNYKKLSDKEINIILNN